MRDHPFQSVKGIGWQVSSFIQQLFLENPMQPATSFLPFDDGARALNPKARDREKMKISL